MNGRGRNGQGRAGYSFAPNEDLIYQALETADEIGRVLRVHLAVEQQANVLIEHVIGRDVSRSLGFGSKVLALRCLQIGEAACDAIEQLNDLRNKLAHNPHATIANTKSIGEKIVRNARASLPNLDDLHIHLVRGSEDVRQFRDLDLGQQVVVVGALYATYLGNMPKNRTFPPPPFLPPQPPRRSA